MARGTGKGGKSGRDETDPEGARLWSSYVHDVTPIKGKSVKAKTAPPAKTSRRKSTQNAAPLWPRAKPSPEKQAPQLDARTEQRLRRGQVPLDGTLDLHGMTQQEALVRLQDYVLGAYARKKRCLLIVTGKGKSGEGVLRQKFPQWIAMEPLKPVVLKILPAIQSHGGGGAWYVYLKRQRDHD